MRYRPLRQTTWPDPALFELGTPASLPSSPHSVVLPTIPRNQDVRLLNRSLKTHSFAS